MSLYISRIMTRWCITYFVIDIPKFPSLFDKGPGPPTFEQWPNLDSKSWNIIWGLIILRKWKLESVGFLETYDKYFSFSNFIEKILMSNICTFWSKSSPMCFPPPPTIHTVVSLVRNICKFWPPNWTYCMNCLYIYIFTYILEH